MEKPCELCGIMEQTSHIKLLYITTSTYKEDYLKEYAYESAFNVCNVCISNIRNHIESLKNTNKKNLYLNKPMVKIIPISEIDNINSLSPKDYIKE